MAKGRAAVLCVRRNCPSKSARWFSIESIDGDGVSVVTVGAAFKCDLCSARWMQMRGQQDPYIPPDDYWKGDEFTSD